MSWCSVTRPASAGRSNTYCNSTPTSGASGGRHPSGRACAQTPLASLRRNRAHAAASRSVSDLHQRRPPDAPGCLPGVRPLLLRNDFGLGLTNGCSAPAAAAVQRPPPAARPPPPGSPPTVSPTRRSPQQTRRRRNADRLVVIHQNCRSLTLSLAEKVGLVQRAHD